jgi:Xaa-Pro aminopeptidase
MFRQSLLLVAALAVSHPAFAEETATSAEEAAQNEPEKKVCRYEGSTGSMMRKRICHTPTEWAKIREANELAARRSLDRSLRGAN